MLMTRTITAPYSAIGERVDLVRLRFTDMSQVEWSAYLGVSTGRYNNWKAGRRRITLDTAQKLCADYGLSLDYIYMGKLDGLSINARNMLSSPASAK